MAALSTFTGVSDVEEVVPTEILSSYVQGFNYAQGVGTALAWRKPGVGSIAVRFPRWNELSVPAGTKAETDTFTDVDITTTEESITPGIVGFRMPISDEMQVQSLGGVPASALDQAAMALANRMDVDILASSTTATHAVGAVTDVYNLSRFRSDLASWWALNIPSGLGNPILTLSHTGGLQLAESLHTSGAVLSKSEGDTLQLGPNGGFLGSIHGVSVYASANLPAESTGHSGMLTTSNESYYGLVVQEMPNVEISRGDEGIQRAVTFYVFRAWYGAGMTNRERGLEILHQ